jgi:uncharacterized membrane protein
MKKVVWFGVVVSVLEAIAGIAVFSRLPEQIPIHWNINYEVDSTAGKWMIFFIPVLSLAITFLMAYTVKLRPRKGLNIPRNNRQYQILIAAFVLLLLALFIVTTLASLKYGMSVSRALPAVLGLFFMVVGNYVPKIGIKKYSDDTPARSIVIQKRFRALGWVILIMGLLLLIGIVLPTPFNALVPLAWVVTGIIAVSVYTLLSARKRRVTNVKYHQ